MATRAITGSALLPSKTFPETPCPLVKRFSGAARAPEGHPLPQTQRAVRRATPGGRAAVRAGPGSGQSGERKGEQKPGGITSASLGQQGESFAGKQGGKVLLWGCSQPLTEEGGGSTLVNRPLPSQHLSRGGLHPGRTIPTGPSELRLSPSPKQDPLGNKKGSS